MLPKTIIKILVISGLCNIIYSEVHSRSISNRNESTSFNSSSSVLYEENGSDGEEEIVGVRNKERLSFGTCIAFPSVKSDYLLEHVSRFLQSTNIAFCFSTTTYRHIYLSLIHI